MKVSSEEYIKGVINSQQIQISEYFDNVLPFDFSYTPIKVVNNIRLGHFAESIFFELLKANLNSTKLLTNVQITCDSKTIGELDAISITDNSIDHIEFCYKIYLFDLSISNNEFECWIGPNRRDSLKQKVEKLRAKQLPLFFNKVTIDYLEGKVPNFSKLEKSQSVCFLGQLYVPYADYENKTDFKYGRVDGFYIHYENLSDFDQAEWFLPSSKVNWLLSPFLEVDWISTFQLSPILNKYYQKDSNPLCWMKHPNGLLYKCFVVNWKLKP